MRGEWALVVMSIVLALMLTYITKLRKENKTNRKIIKYQKQIIDGNDKDQ